MSKRQKSLKTLCYVGIGILVKHQERKCMCTSGDQSEIFHRITFFYVQKNTQSLPCEVLISSLIEMESTMNESTIGKCSTDFNDMIALTQNHLLLARANPSVPSDVIFVKQPEIKKTRR
jgi:hypothetical protein